MLSLKRKGVGKYIFLYLLLRITVMKGKSHNGLFSIYDHKEQKKGKYVSNEN
jgi:hypothetical protein